MQEVKQILAYEPLLISKWWEREVLQIQFMHKIEKNKISLNDNEMHAVNAYTILTLSTKQHIYHASITKRRKHKFLLFWDYLSIKNA